MFLICFVSQGVEQDAKIASKNIISGVSYVFFKSGSQYNYYKYTRANFKLLYLKTTLETFFEKTMHGRGPKLSSYVPLMSFNKLKSGIFEKKKNRFLWSKMYARFANFGTFLRKPCMV